MTRKLKTAFFSALLVMAVAYPVLGLKLSVIGIGLQLENVSPTRLWTIAACAVLMFVWQLVRDRFAFGGSVKQALSHPHTRLAERLTHASVQRKIIMGLIVVAVAWPFLVSRGAVDIATLTLIYVMLGLGLNIVVGLSGLLVLGYVGFYAIGAYTYALLNHYYGLGFWACLPLAGLISAAFFGFLLGFPVLRLRGDYLAIVTLGFGEIVRILLLNITEITGGPNGISQIPKPTLFGLTFERRRPRGHADLPRVLRHRLQHELQGHLPLPGGAAAGAADPVRDQPPAAHAAGPRLGSAARRRDRLPFAGPEPDAHQAVRLHHQRRVRRFRRHASSPRARASSPRNRSPSSNRPSSWRSWCWAAWARSSA